jgi:hypothetical protein
VAEAPVVLLGIEEVRNFSAEIFVFLVVFDSQLRAGLAAPRRGLRLAVALEEVAHAFRRSVAAGTADLVSSVLNRFFPSSIMQRQDKLDGLSRESSLISMIDKQTSCMSCF